MAAEIVHDDNVTWYQSPDQLLSHISEEAFAVDRAVEDAWRSEPIATQRAQKRQRAPASVRGKSMQALALRSPAVERGHIGSDPGFVNEHKAMWIEAALPVPPTRPASGNVGASLFKGEHRFF